MPKPDQTLDDILDPIARGLTGTKPEPVPEPDPKILLDHIAEVSKNARAIWFGLLGLLAFVGVTLLAHKDADFFAFGAETQLPLIGITVPVKVFFYIAPVLVAGLYAYLQLYLMTLWDGLADAPARIGDQPLADRVFPWLLSYAALWYRNRTRKDDCAAPRSLGLVVVAVSLALGFAFAIAVLTLLWWRSMPAHDEWLTLWIGVNFWFAFLVGQTGFLTVRARMAGATRASVAKARWGRHVVGGIALIILACLSWLRTEGGFENYAGWIEDNGEWTGSSQPAAWLNANLPTTKGIADRTDLRWFRLYPANLREAELTRKSSDWLPFDIWLEEFATKYRKRKGIAKETELSTDREFIAEATQRYNAPLAAPDLQGADLRNARMTSAFLPGADVREARLQGAFFYRAYMQGANLEKAKLNDALFRLAQMQGVSLKLATMDRASFRGARLNGADLQSVEMPEANFSLARMEGVNLTAAKMQRASFRGARLSGADLARAQMQGAKFQSAEMRGVRLSGAQMQGVNLTSADLFDADLSLANLTGADLDRANLEGANLKQVSFVSAALRSTNFTGASLTSAQFDNALLGGADFSGADCNLALFSNAVLHSAKLGCANLSQAQLEGAIGNERTVLPDGLTVLSCFATPPEDFEDMLAHVEEENRPKVRAQLLCPAGETPRIIGAADTGGN